MLVSFLKILKKSKIKRTTSKLFERAIWKSRHWGEKEKKEEAFSHPTHNNSQHEIKLKVNIKWRRCFVNSAVHFAWEQLIDYALAVGIKFIWHFINSKHLSIIRLIYNHLKSASFGICVSSHFTTTPEISGMILREQWKSCHDEH